MKSDVMRLAAPLLIRSSKPGRLCSEEPEIAASENSATTCQPSRTA
jgi:hypothetical protein